MRSVVRFLSFIITLCLFAGLVGYVPATATAAPAAPATPVAAAAPAVDAGKMMVVGDSISHGSSGDWTWRYRLAKHLAANGVTVDMVGPRSDLENIMTTQEGDGDQTYADPGFDRDHDAQWGRPLAFEMNDIAGKVTTYQPDYLLVLLGINDLGFFGHTPERVGQDLHTFIANARSAKPGLKFVVGKLLATQRATDEPEFAAKVAATNTEIAEAATELSTAASPVVVADATGEFVAKDHTWDGTHPNGRGELRIAASYADVLSARFGIGATYPRPYPEPAVGPQQPPQATVTSTGPGTADLAWTPSVGATAYWVWTKDQGFNQEWTKLPIPLTIPDYNPWHMTDLLPGMTYQWKLQATKGWDAGAFSNEVTLVVPGDPPGPATGFTITAGNAAARLKWTPAAKATGYFIHQRNVTAGETTFTRLPYPVPESEWTAESLVNGMTYEYKIQPVNGMIEGPVSNAVAVTPTGPVPVAVTDLTIENGNAEATLKWTPVEHATGYYVYVKNVRPLGETTFTKLPWPVSGPEWTSESLLNGGSYEFRIASANGIIAGPQSNTAVANPFTAPPAGPESFTAAPGNAEATLSWTAATDATGYWVHMRNVTAGDEGFTKLPYPVTGTEWTAGSLVNGGTYEFKLQSQSGLIDGLFSRTVTVRPTVAAPAGPADFTVTAGDHEATLNWNEATNATGYWVHMRNVTAGDEGFTRLPYPVTGTEWTAGSLVNGGTYEFKLQSQSGLIDGGFSRTVSVRAVGPAPSAPTDLTAKPGNRKATLTWDMPRHATGVYIWMRNATAGESFQRLPYPVSDDTFAAGFMANGVSYEFKVQAYNDLIAGATSGVVAVTPRAPTPTISNFSVRPGNQKATLTWDGAASANNYHIWVREVTFGKDWRELPFPVDEERFVMSYLVNGATFEFKIRAYSDAQPGGWSPVVSVVPRGPVPQVSNLKVRARLGEAYLTWSTSSTSTGYYIYLRNASRGEGFTQLPYAVTGNNFTAGVLIPGDRYEFSVQAVSGLQRGEYTNTVGVTLPLPAAPRWVSAKQGGPYEAKVSWAAVSGADSYVIYHGVSNAIWDKPVMTRLPYPVKGTDFNVGYLVQKGIHWFGVAASKNGSVGPVSETSGTMAPLMDNPFYNAARHRFFDAGAASGDRKLVTSAARAGQDGGIVIARAFIEQKGAYVPIGDRRGYLGDRYSPEPYASSRMVAAWDTRRGQLGVYAQQSCVYIGITKCNSALPIVEAYSGADDTDRVNANYVWKSGSGDSFTVHWKASNSDTNGTVWPLTAHIDTQIAMWRASGKNFSATLYTDHFPTYEVYQYPHYTANGVPEVRTLVQCGQYQINGLLDKPSERRTC